MNKKPNYGAIACIVVNFNKYTKLLRNSSKSYLTSCMYDYDHKPVKDGLKEIDEALDDLVSAVLFNRFGNRPQHLVKCFYCPRYKERTADSEDGFCDYLKEEVTENSFCYRFFKEYRKNENLMEVQK